MSMRSARAAEVAPVNPEALSDVDLERLASAVANGRLRGELSPPLASRLGLQNVLRHLDVQGLSASALGVLARALLAERAARPPQPELVWTGPEGRTGRGRRTAEVLRDIFESAEREVWLAGYSVTHGAELFAPLHRVMQERGVSARFLLHPSYKKGEPRSPTVSAGADLLLNRFLAEHWPFPGPSPELYYDRRSLESRARSNMHIKAVVVDEARVLIGSANFTKQGTERSLEAGVYLENPDFARRLVTALNGLVSGGHVLKHGSSS